MVRVISSDSRNSLNSPERNLRTHPRCPCVVLPHDAHGFGLADARERVQLGDPTKDRTRCNASDLDFKKRLV